MAVKVTQAGDQRESRGLPRLSPAAFAVRFEDSSRMLWCIAAAVLGRRDLAEDVLQEAVIIALTKLDEFDPETSFTAWMGRIVRYVALNMGRRRARRAATPLDHEPMELAAATDAGVETAVTSQGHLDSNQEAFDDRVQAALNSLEEIARACLLLKTVMDLPYREIALALDIPEGTAMSHVHRARAAMRQRLAGNAKQGRRRGGDDQ